MPGACCLVCYVQLLGPHITPTPTPTPTLSQVNKYAFSGGGATLEEHRSKGANLDVDVPWKYLNFFMEDDARLAEIGREYKGGRMLTGGGGGRLHI
jgi:tryptophanyl-tRNA synthetase